MCCISIIKKALRSLTTCLIRAGGFLFGNYGKIAPMVERWIEAPRVTGSSLASLGRLEHSSA